MMDAMTNTRTCDHGVTYEPDFDNRPDCCSDPEDDGRGEPIPLRMLQASDPSQWGLLPDLREAVAKACDEAPACRDEQNGCLGNCQTRCMIAADSGAGRGIEGMGRPLPAHFRPCATCGKRVLMTHRTSANPTGKPARHPCDSDSIREHTSRCEVGKCPVCRGHLWGEITMQTDALAGPLEWPVAMTLTHECDTRRGWR